MWKYILSPLIGLINSCIVSVLDGSGLEDADLNLGETMTVICERYVDEGSEVYLLRRSSCYLRKSRLVFVEESSGVFSYELISFVSGQVSEACACVFA